MTAVSLPGLDAHDARVADDLISIGWPGKPWMPALTHEGQAVHDVIVIGAGQAGLAAAFGFAQQGIAATLLDRAPPGEEGPWATTARMETLRSPKELTGPAMGVPSLTFRAWFVAQFGTEAWATLDKIPRLQWMDYLRWYRRVTRAQVVNGCEVLVVEPTPHRLVRLRVRDTGVPGTERTLLARRVALATGRDGLGGPAIPAFVNGLPRHRWAHSSDALDYTQLRGKRVAIVGAGSSAMDSAATALENGAACVDLFVRRADIPRINKSKASGVPGLTHGHHDLPDAWKWRIRHYINAQQVPPPRGSTQRVSRHPNAYFHTGAPIERIETRPAADSRPDSLRIHTPRGTLDADFLIVSTGFVIDWAQRPAFAAFAPHVRLWQDRFRPDPADADAELAASPDLGPVFEFQEKTPGACPGLDRIHAFCYPAALSFGTISGDIPAISDGARRLTTGIASLFYREDVEHHWRVLQDYAEPELQGDEWTPAAPGRLVPRE